MGRFPTVDGSPTETITLRLPTWLLDRYKNEALAVNSPVREYIRYVLISNAPKGEQ